MRGVILRRAVSTAAIPMSKNAGASPTMGATACRAPPERLGARTSPPKAAVASAPLRRRSRPGVVRVSWPAHPHRPVFLTANTPYAVSSPSARAVVGIATAAGPTSTIPATTTSMMEITTSSGTGIPLLPGHQMPRTLSGKDASLLKPIRAITVAAGNRNPRIAAAIIWRKAPPGFSPQGASSLASPGRCPRLSARLRLRPQSLETRPWQCRPRVPFPPD